ncbi:hypothetical protein NE865_08651 [Phthorimaea operculella]|nr:hypothetical protein NE865_08651 [Phthorimaea operculella]
MTVFLSRIAFTTFKSAGSKCFSVNLLSEVVAQKSRFLCARNDLFCIARQQGVRNYVTDTIEPPAPAIPLKQKSIYKRPDVQDLAKKGHYLTLAYATANSYDLKGLKNALVEQKLYEPGRLNAHEIGDVVVANAVYTVGDEPREIIFFREGAVVFWNCTELEASNVLDFVKGFEIESYPRDVVEKEKEIMSYIYQPNAKKCHQQESCFVLVPDRDNSMERYTFSHAMAQSARLGAWEARLEALAASVRMHTAFMEREGMTNIEKKEDSRIFSILHVRYMNIEISLLNVANRKVLGSISLETL